MDGSRQQVSSASMYGEICYFDTGNVKPSGVQPGVKVPGVLTLLNAAIGSYSSSSLKIRRSACVTSPTTSEPNVSEGNLGSRRAERESNSNK